MKNLSTIFFTLNIEKTSGVLGLFLGTSTFYKRAILALLEEADQSLNKHKCRNTKRQSHMGYNKCNFARSAILQEVQFCKVSSLKSDRLKLRNVA